MASRNTIRKEFPPVRKVTQKGYTYYLVDCRRKGLAIRQRYQFTTKSEALEKAQEVAKQYGSTGIDGLNAFSSAVSDRQLRGWIDQLDAYGATLEDAVKHFIVHCAEEQRKKQVPKLSELAELWYRSKKDDKSKLIRPRSLKDIGNWSRRIARQWGELRPDELTEEIIRDYLNQMVTEDGNEVSNQTRKNTLNKIKQFFNWLVATKRIATNHLNGIKWEVETSTPEAYSIEEVKSILSLVQEELYSPLRNYVVLGLFAGLRPEEADRLNWDLLQNDHIEIRRQNTKVKYPRTISIESPLKEWLQIGSRNQELIPKNFKRRKALLRKAMNEIGIREIDDGFRHTYATYWLSINQNRPKLAELLGNSVPIITKHYVRPVSKTDANIFFSMVPEFIAQKKPTI